MRKGEEKEEEEKNTGERREKSLDLRTQRRFGQKGLAEMTDDYASPTRDNFQRKSFVMVMMILKETMITKEKCTVRRQTRCLD